MQTFLPYSNFVETAKVLDMRRLGKQRVECKQILMALADETDAWKNHPCTRMWKGFEHWLIDYGETICDEWINRGYKDSTKNCITNYRNRFDPHNIIPFWLYDRRVTDSHKAVLLFKNPEHYSRFGWNVEPTEKVNWPVPVKGD